MAVSDAALKEAFDLFDCDDSGSIETDELGLLCEALGLGVLPRQELDEMIKEVDIDGSGAMEFSEFKLLISRRRLKEGSTEEVVAAFNKFAGPDGTIGADDIANVARCINERVNMEQYYRIIDAVNQEYGQKQQAGGSLDDMPASRACINKEKWERMMSDASAWGNKHLATDDWQR